MAIQGPVGKENLEISFRLQSKTQLIDGSKNDFLSARCDIVSSASTHGIVFVGSSNPELIIVCLRDLEAAELNVPVRKVPLPSPTLQIASNCDGSILAVALKINGTPHIQLYSVASFLTPNIQKLREFRLSSDNSDAIQLSWNPVLSSTLAVCTETGGLNTYTLKEQGLEFHSIDPNLKAKCCCWSPKGKQIVVGFANGKLMQFTPELKPAKIIECPPGVVAGGTFDTIAVQWLSTFQFAVAFLCHQPESRPVLHIVNAPKAGPPQYFAYNDVCYSTSESRPSKIYLQHIMQWNLLLVSSANSIDVSFLRISQPGDLPVWTQEFPNDLFPAELPLTPNKDESYPLGFTLETGCANRLLQEDGITPYPVMPMVHILSTFGVLCSFYILNTSQSYVDICSPPRPLDSSVKTLFKVNEAPLQEKAMKTPSKQEIPFSEPIGQSTPVLLKLQPPTAKSFPVGNLPAVSFGGITQSTTPSLSFAPTANSQTRSTVQQIVPTPISIQPQPAQALITVPPTFSPTVAQNNLKNSNNQIPNDQSSHDEDEMIFGRMIQDEMKAFELELNAVMEKSRSINVNIGTKEESAEMRRKIEELDELKKEATETIESLRSDVQSNRLGITEMFSMIYETRTKLDQTKHQKSIFMNQNQIQDRACQRTLDKLVKQVSHCEMQLQIAIEVMNSQWSNYQEAIKKNKKNRMHNPSLEGLYQTLTKQQEIIYRQVEKIDLLKAKLGIRGNYKTSGTNPVIESFSDTMISLSLCDQVEKENSKMTTKKLNHLRNLLTHRPVLIIRPERPERLGLDSEIILEKRLKTLKEINRKEQKLGAAKISEASTFPKQKTEETGKRSFGAETTKDAPAPLAVPPKTSQPNKASSSGFGTASNISPQISFLASSSQGSGASTTAEKPFFGFNPTATQNSSFGLNLSIPKPSFGLSSAPLVLGIEKKKDDVSTVPFSASNKQAPTQNLNPDILKTSESNKIPSTISNANVAISATFSIPLANKVTTLAQNNSKVVEKSLDENNPQTTNENTSFTFKLSEKKDKAPAIPNFGSLLSGGNESSKGFSFTSGNAASFEPAPKAQEISKTSAVVSTSVSTPVSGSLFGSSASGFKGFGSGFSGFGNENTKSGFSLNLGSTGETSKATTTAGSFSFSSLTPSVESSASDTKPLSTPASLVSSKPVTSSTFSFGTALGDALADVKSNKPDSAPAPAQPSLSFASANAFTTSGVTLGSAKSDSSSLFSSNTFGQAFGETSTDASVFSSPPVQAASTIATPTPSTAAPTPSTQTSIFGTQQSAPTSSSPSIFGSLSLGTNDPNKSPPASPPTGLFSSTGKPDKSVFGVTSSAASPTTSTFGGGFTTSTTSSIFGAPAAISPSTNVFATGADQTPGNIFGTSQPATTQVSAFGVPPKGQTSVFGQNTATNATGGSLFSQSSFASPPSTNAFGASAQPTSPFGSSNIFGSTTSPQQSSTGSIFGGQSSFGTQPATGSVFGGSSTIATSPFGSSSVFGGAASFSNAFGGAGQTFGSGVSSSSPFNQQSPTFGGGATFGSPKASIFGQQSASVPSNNLFEQLGSQQSGNLFGNINTTTPAVQPQPPQPGFQGSAFSSWR